MNNNFFESEKKHIILWAIMSIVLEILFLVEMLKTKSNIIILLGVIAIPISLAICMYMLKDIKSAFYSFALVVPLMPISGYVSLRLGLSSYQWGIYIIFYAIFLISIIKNGVFKKLNFKLKFSVDNVFLCLLFLLIFINVLTAFNKSISMLIFFLAIVPAILFFFLLSYIEIDNKEEMIKNVIMAFCIGVAVSSIPDTFIFFILWSRGMKTYRMYGPLGSNFLLGYSLLMYPFIIIRAKNEVGIRKKIYRILLLIEVISLCTQFSRGIIIGVFGVFIVLLLDRKNFKYYISILTVVMICLGINVYQRPEISKNAYGSINMMGKKNAKIKKNVSDETYISSQSDNRRPIWNTAVSMFEHNSVLGVGVGNFQFFYSKYSHTNKTYLDAHNFVLTNLSEMGIIFTSVLVVYLGYIFISSLVYAHRNKGNKPLRLAYLGIVAGLFGYLAFSNITGAAFECAHEVHSYTPIFVFSFVIYYYITLKKQKTSF